MFKLEQKMNNSVIDFTNICFHDNSGDCPVKLFNEDKYKFGILNIKIRNEIPITTKHIHIFFTIDSSYSMNDVCKDGKTKMEHITYTLKNMLQIFNEKLECNISIHIQSFNKKVKTIISDVSDIHKFDIEVLNKLLNKIEPDGLTNIELALKNGREEINKYYNINPEHEIIHIFLTDGEITDGSRNYNILSSLVPETCKNIFIGYGNTHDSKLLSHLSSTKYNEYRFIDALDKAGLVYGEIIHEILYKAIEDVTLSCLNCEIYDYKTNMWKTSLQIGNLVREQNKTFQIRSENVKNCHISIFGKSIIKTEQFDKIGIYNKFETVYSQNMSDNLVIYIFRQKTQELLYKARHILEKQNKKSSFPIIQIQRFKTKIYDDFEDLKTKNNTIDAIDAVKKELSEFHKNLVNYMKEKNIETNPILTMLCDDIYITYKTIDTYVGIMYTCARQTSNGQQQSYMCSAATDLYDNSILEESHMFNEVGNNEIDNYVPTQDFLSPFSSNSVINVMRYVSGNDLMYGRDQIK